MCIRLNRRSNQLIDLHTNLTHCKNIYVLLTNSELFVENYMPILQTAQIQNPLTLQFQRIRKQTEALAKPLSAEDCQVQSMPDASPAKWHLAHLTWFFETFILEKYEKNFKPFNASFRVLFNSYYNGIGDKHFERGAGLSTGSRRTRTGSVKPAPA